MRFARTTLALSAAALLSLPALAEEHKMRPGQYELTTEMEMEGMGPMPSRTSSRCYTESDVQDYKKMVQEGQERNKDCDVTDLKSSGNHVSYSMTCKSGTKGDGEMTFHPDRYEVKLNLQMSGGPHGPMKVKIEIFGKRTGDCAK